MQSRPIEELPEAIISIVNDNSGGLKIIKLMTDLVISGFLHITPDNVLETIRTNNRCKETLSILEYTWDGWRQKLFIYTP